MASRHNFKAVFFDLDGTLADTAPDLAMALNKLMLEQGLDPLPYARIRSHVSQGAAAIIRLAFGCDLADEPFERLRCRFLDIYGENLCDYTRLFPDMESVLSEIELMGLTWGIVTNKLSWMTEPIVAALGLKHRAVCIVSGDTTIERKPHPKPLLHACKVAGVVPKQCLYVGDDPRDILAGNAAGMTTLIAGYGYIQDHSAPEDWGAHGIIDDVNDLLKWIEPDRIFDAINTTS